MEKTLTDANLAIGQRVKIARSRLRLSQQQLAAKIQTSQSCISLWENGINGASVAFFFKLADALQVDARWLATGEARGDVPDTRQRRLRIGMRNLG
jgi:transcriptional regulator with XRE-family HTH domain